MKNVLLFKFTCVLLSLCSSVFGQDFSNKGRDFWVVYTGHVDGTVSRMALYITSDKDATGQVDIDGNIIPFTVTANNVTTVQLTNSSNPSNILVYNGQIEGIGAKKGIHITADKPVVVYSHILNSARSGSTLVLPTPVLGKEYFASSYSPIGANSTDRSEFAIVAPADNTVVEITPTAADANSVHLANVPFLIKLNRGDVYQYQSNGDLTGTHIKSVGTPTTSCQAIGVFSGSTRSSLGCAKPNSGDNLYQQLFPFASWGRLYYTAPFINRSFDIFRIIVQDPTTVVSVNGVPLNKSSLINGRFYEISTEGDNTGKTISSDKPICVFQYLISQGCDDVQSDPEMIILSAADQTLNNITVMSARADLTPPNTNIVSHFLNIIFKTSTFSSLLIDGNQPTATPIAISGTEYSYLQENVTASTNNNPSHQITSDSGFSCIAYGYGNIESYGYNAGTNVTDRYQYITMQSSAASVNFPATCSNTPFSLAITLSFKPTSLRWDFNNNPNLSPNTPVTNNAPVPDSSFNKDGKTLYVYKLKSLYKYSLAGSFPIKVSAYNPVAEGCGGNQDISYNVVIHDKPKADFVIVNGACLPTTIQFKDNSNSHGRPVTSYTWSFGDNTSASIKNPTKKYNSAAVYPVKLSIVDDIGCAHDTTKPVAVTSVPVPGFYFQPEACTFSPIKFYDSSKVAIGTISKWKWNFGDSTSTVNNTTNAMIIHSYNRGGTYTIKLSVETGGGCSDSLSKTINIKSGAAVNFIAPEVCLNDAFAQFTDSSFIDDGSKNNLKYMWNFGDDQATLANPDTSSLQNPKHTYSLTGNYNATLTVTSKDGCISSKTKTFSVNGSTPVADFDVKDSNNLCSNTTVEIINRSKVAPGVITKIEIVWDAANAPARVYTDEIPYPGKVYGNRFPRLAVTKSYDILLRAFSGQSCVSEIQKSVTVKGSPEVSFMPIADVCYNAAARQITENRERSGLPGSGFFSGTAISPTGLFTPTSTFLTTSSGTVPIMYTYLSDNGCKDSAKATIKVWKVTLDAGLDLLVKDGNSATFEPEVFGDNLVFTWSPATFLNNNKIKNAVITPTSDVTYTLTVTGNGGCSASDKVQVNVLKQPEVPNAFSPNNDGINDVWNIRYLAASSETTVEVYNRFGRIVYRSVGYNRPWDGTCNGVPLPIGVYYYLIDPKLGRQKMSGSVTILR